MTAKKRNSLAALLLLLLCALSAFGGFYLGSERALLESVTPVIGSNALLHKSLLKSLENGKIDDAKQRLNMMLDGEIIELHVYQAKLPDGERKRISVQTLAKIAEYRRKHPSNALTPEGDKKVKDILEQFPATDRKNKEKQR